MDYQNGDIKLFLTNEGFDINLKENFIEMTNGFESAVYLSLFGGNDEDDASEATKKNRFWGNELNDYEYRSKTLNFINGRNANAQNLKLLEKYVLLDLNWFVEENIADKVEADCSIPAFNELKIEIKLLRNNKLLFNSNYRLNWKSQ